MATQVILPALGMAQDTGKIVRWLKAEGEPVTQGEPLVEIETDKATVEIEAPARGILAHISALAGDEIPVGQVIASIIAPGETVTEGQRSFARTAEEPGPTISHVPSSVTTGGRTTIAASPLAARIAAEHNLDLSRVKAAGKRVQKADVLAHLQQAPSPTAPKTPTRLTMASPKARRLASEQGKDLATIKGSGPGGAVLAADVLHAPSQAPATAARAETGEQTIAESQGIPVSTIWRIMAERTTQSWTSTPHFALVREVNASGLLAWREQAEKRSDANITYTDLLVKAVAAALRKHPRLNASWHAGQILLQQEIHIGLAVAVEEGLVVPVIHQADTLGLNEIARRRQALLARAQAGKLRPDDLRDGTFTISNLGMYNVDAFQAIINQPQAAILAVGRIAERVVAIDGQPAVRPTLILTLSCDHRASDGARAAQFLATLAGFIEEPLRLLD